MWEGCGTAPAGRSGLSFGRRPGGSAATGFFWTSPPRGTLLALREATAPLSAAGWGSAARAAAEGSPSHGAPPSPRNSLLAAHARLSLHRFCSRGPRGHGWKHPPHQGRAGLRKEDVGTAGMTASLPASEAGDGGQGPSPARCLGRRSGCHQRSPALFCRAERAGEGPVRPLRVRCRRWRSPRCVTGLPRANPRWPFLA